MCVICLGQFIFFGIYAIIIYALLYKIILKLQNRILFMPKSQKLTTQKVFTFKTLSLNHLEQVTKHIVTNSQLFNYNGPVGFNHELNESSQVDSEKGKIFKMKLYQKDTCSLTNSKKIERKDDFISYLYSLANTIAIPALKSEWSFGIWDNAGVQILGVYLQIDLLDYIKISNQFSQSQISLLFTVGQFTEHLTELSKYVKRGDYLITLYSTNNMNNCSCSRTGVGREQINVIYQGFYFCKLGGWKNIIFQTYNPIPFLKINGDVIRVREKQEMCLSIPLERESNSQKYTEVQPSQKLKRKKQLGISEYEELKECWIQKSYLIKINMTQLSLNKNISQKINAKL